MKFFSPIHVGHNYRYPFIPILFETSICQNNSSEFSPVMPDEVREHLTSVNFVNDDDEEK